MSSKRGVLAAVSCGTFMATFDASVVNIVLPTLTKDLSSPLQWVKWVVMIYLLVITCCLLPFGRLSDQKGRKLIFQWGFFIFILGSGLCSFSSLLIELLFFRAIQATGAAMLMANGPAIITSHFSSHERGSALGILAMVVSAGLVSGPSLGGLLIAYIDWRGIFWINIPVGLLGMLLVHIFVKKEEKLTQKSPFDWTGAVLQILIMFLFTIGFDSYRTAELGYLLPSWLRVIALILLTGLVIGFLKWESRVPAPLFDLSLMKNRVFWTANLASFLTFVALQSISVLMPFFLSEVYHLPSQKAGIVMAVVPITIFFIAPLSGRFSDRWGSQKFSVLGSFVSAMSLLMISDGKWGYGFHAKTPEWYVFFLLGCMGFGLGLFQSPNNSAIMSSVPMNKLGVASAMLATIRNLGLMIGTGLASTFFSWKIAQGDAFVPAFQSTLRIAGWIAVIAMVASFGKNHFMDLEKIDVEKT